MNLKPVTDFFGAIMDRFGIGYFFGQPADTITFWFLLAGFAMVLAFTIGFYLSLKMKSRKLKPYRSYAKTFFWPNVTLVALALVNLFGRYENLTLISWRFWMYLILAILIAYNGWFFVKRKEQLDEELAALADAQRKAKWLKPRR